MSIYDFEVTQTNGNVISLADYKGKTLLLVNTASKCTFTPQYDDLQKLYDRFREQEFEILAFPCNQFGEQEPGTNEEATSFCQLNYGVKFPVFAKLEVNGADAHPLFQHLKQQAPFGGFDESDIQAKLLRLMISEKNPEWLVGDSIKWNFTKFLIDANGDVVRRYEPFESPLDFAVDIERSVSHSLQNK
ncbi:glutathione peroxidase [Paenibacillus sp. 481]|uniref:glutathione peroxidase n=1 Tax=Paenibacillus sp. 481 TaxID=2835869 RepID=UPI001E5E9CD7|nr:glutathione peroxidase [Paenibacillus sp. 481]UHA72229.1 glutathione peroxidase [Paenibacillus sp. 481]